jgi:hypothetical protein
VSADADPPTCRVCGEPLETDIDRHRTVHTDCHVGRI